MSSAKKLFEDLLLVVQMRRIEEPEDPEEEE